MSSTATSIGPSRWFLVRRPHCVPPLPELETALCAIGLLGAAIALTLAATIEQRRLNGHNLCSAIDVGFSHFRTGAFSGTTAIYWLLSRTWNIVRRAAPVIHADLNRFNRAAAGTFRFSCHAADHLLKQGKHGDACAAGPSFSGFLLCEAALELSRPYRCRTHPKQTWYVPYYSPMQLQHLEFPATAAVGTWWVSLGPCRRLGQLVSCFAFPARHTVINPTSRRHSYEKYGFPIFY